jgi:general secretion pathway protein J
MKLRPAPRRSTVFGFTLIEALIAMSLMVTILATLATVTAQWLPNWSHGFTRLQRLELLSFGLERIVTDLKSAEFVAPNRETEQPLFEGAALSVTFVRSAIGPNTRPGLDVVHIAETVDERGFVMVRTRGPLVPFGRKGESQSPRLGDPVALVRAPYRVSFSYAGSDRVWRDTWRDALTLPSAVRVTVRDASTARLLRVSTAALIHIDAPASCAREKRPSDCPQSPAVAQNANSMQLGAKPEP